MVNLKYLALAAATASLATSVWAAGDLSRANVIDVAMELGTDDDGKMYMKPDNYEFETGQAYALVITNVDPIKHELALNEMTERIFTRKIEIQDKNGELVAEIKGSINEVEVGPGWTVEWYFVPVQTMDATEITCELEGHYDAGMKAMASIK